LIFIGGLVRVSGAGMGCPDWPKCFDRWIPPLSAAQLPPNIDPGQFNFTLAWIEYFNRLAGVAVGLLIAAVVLWALVKYYRHIKIVVPAVLAGLFTVFQAWHGSRVVASNLEPLIVSVHMLLALLIVSLLIYVSLQAHYLDNPTQARRSSRSGGQRFLLGGLWVLTLVQVVIGTQFREAIEKVPHQFPLLFGSDIINKVGFVKYIHPVLGIIIAVIVIPLVIKLAGKGSNPSPLVWQSAWTMLGLVMIQIVVGIIIIVAGIPQVFQVLHLWTASLLAGAAMITFIDSGRGEEA
jgi:cytochrome c oxidase assembly protein subunit 15